MKLTVNQRQMSQSYWLRDAIASARARDPVDALADAEELVEILRRQLTVITTTAWSEK